MNHNQPNVTSLKLAEQTLAYAQYLFDHIKNINVAMEKFEKLYRESGGQWPGFTSKKGFENLKKEGSRHDMSKFGVMEFQAYRKTFYPAGVGDSSAVSFDEAWEHHKTANMHHWETWTSYYNSPAKEGEPEFNFPVWEIHSAHMVLDWIAMGMANGSKASAYFEKTSPKMGLTPKQYDFINRIIVKMEQE